ncbi:DUF4123 domain-containing protein [Paraburkholderia sp. GAS348]|uniref:DUF4123 domain-containing protein n=1 Tax=Paraburkholderia sp. GAS348 TaxID=3035132 RepID=UPI003D1BADCD
MMSTTVQPPAAPDADSRWVEFQSRVEAARRKHELNDLQTCLYALVDTRGLPDLRVALQRLDAIAFEALWDRTDLAAFADVAPLLIKVDLGAADTDVPQQLLKRLWQFSDREFMLTWIWSPHGLDNLAEHFRSYCEYTLANRRTFYLHFYDNRILERLRLTWTAEEWTRFASVAFEIWYRNRSGEDGSWCADVLSQPVRNAEFALTDEQHLMLFSLGYADKVVIQITELCGCLLEHLSPDDLYRTVRTQVERATHYGVRDEGDMLQYVAKGLFVSPRFDEHPLIRKGLESARYGEVPFAEVLSQVDETLGDGYAGRRAT